MNESDRHNGRRSGQQYGWFALILPAFFMMADPALSQQSVKESAQEPRPEAPAAEANQNTADTAPILSLKATQVDTAFGAFQRGFYLTARDLALPRAKLGDPAAQTLLGEIYANGYGVPQDMKQAAFWYQQGAKNDDPAACFSYAILLLEGRHVERDYDRAKSLMQKAAEAGYANAQFNYAQMLIADTPGNGGVKAAIPYFRDAAQSRLPDAQYAMAQIYKTGRGLDKPDPAEALKYLRAAAVGGIDTAQVELGIMLIDGEGGTKDLKRGFTWIKKAAEGGNIEARNRLAHLYRNGIGTDGDQGAAAMWYIISKRAGRSDPLLEDFFQGLTVEEQKKALERANTVRF